MNVGVLKWYDEKKGFGVIDTPDKGEFFIHVSNFTRRATSISPGTVWIFDEAFEKGKKSAKNCHLPSSYKDFLTILDYLGKEGRVKIERKNKGIVGHLKNDHLIISVVDHGLQQLLKNLGDDDILNWIKKYYHDKIREKTSELFIPFCKKIKKQLASRDKAKEIYDAVFIYFGNNLTESILFNVWKNKFFDLIGYIGHEDYEIPQDILWDNRQLLASTEFQRIKYFKYGDEFIEKYVKERTRSLEGNTEDDLLVLKECLPLAKLISEEGRRRQELVEGLYSQAESTITLLIKSHSELLPEISNEVNFQEYQALFRFIPKELGLPKQQELIDLIKDSAINKCSDEYKVHLWLEGWGDNIDPVLLKSSFTGREDVHFYVKALKRIEKKEERLEALDILLSLKKWEYALKVIEEYFGDANELEYGFSLKKKLFDDSFLMGKKGSELVQFFKQKIIDYSVPSELTSLFLEQLSNTYDNEFVVSNACQFSISQLEEFFKSENQAKSESFILEVLTQKLTCCHNKEEFTDIFDLGNRYLPKESFSQLDESIFNKAPKDDYFEFWKKGIGKCFPESSLSNHLNDEPEPYEEIDIWLEEEIVKKTKIIDFLLKSIGEEVENGIDDRLSFYRCYFRVKKLLELDPSNNREALMGINNSFIQILLWFFNVSEVFSFDLLKGKFIYFSPEDQAMVIRKLFRLKALGLLALTVDMLSELVRASIDLYELNKKFHPNIPLDLSTEVIVQALKSFSEKQRFLVDGELIEIVLKNIYGNETRKFQIARFFESCPGRCSAEFNWHTEGAVSKVPFGQEKFYFALSFSPTHSKQVNSNRGYYITTTPNPNFQTLKEEVKKLPGAKWNPKKRHWGVPSKYEDDVLEFAKRHQLFLDFEGSNYANNPHLAELKRGSQPEGITFCEGRPALKEHNILRRKFWWCANQPCFENAETIHKLEEWESYTLLDFCLILGLNTDEKNKYGFFPHGLYYQFVSKINRFNRLLEKLYCEECDHILYPSESSNFAAYTVTRFYCQNDQCKEHGKDVYLNHCLNGKCDSIIDSRESKKCPNGLFICSECGSCCSHDMLKRRLGNLELTGGYIHENLRINVQNKDGHLEKAEYYCYKCGGMATQTKAEVFECTDCGVTYDLGSYRLKRPHLHLRRKDYPIEDNRDGEGGFDGSADYPF
ncbi:MAG: cold shock domain-containing protein [Halobacteriovoraceae bacterium]|nr:cold shock domain-containing protein [Halobacteriovoraceae bacterium]